MTEADIILAMAKEIQRIEHKGFHTWETCHESARARAVMQAEACFKVVSALQHKLGV